MGDNSLYKRKFAKIQAGYERIFLQKYERYVIRVKIRALKAKYSIFFYFFLTKPKRFTTPFLTLQNHIEKKVRTVII